MSWHSTCLSHFLSHFMMFWDLTISVLWTGMWLLESFVVSDLLFDDGELDGEVVREAAICQSPAEASRKIHRIYWKTSRAVGLFFLWDNLQPLAIFNRGRLGKSSGARIEFLKTGMSLQSNGTWALHFDDLPAFGSRSCDGGLGLGLKPAKKM